jgi:serine/threonine-protein kinase/endoribonuclease IRE1
MLAAFQAAAAKENQALIASDHHPAIVRCYALEQDDHFLYLALERCPASLAALFDADPLDSGARGGR